MRRSFFVIPLLMAACAALAACAPDEAGDAPADLRPIEGELWGVFQGRVQCEPTNLAALPTPSPTPLDGECQVVKVALQLYRDDLDRPSEYRLLRVIVGQGNNVLVTDGTWTQYEGLPGQPDARVLALDSNSPPLYRSLLVVDENILLFLDSDLRPLLGGASWSFTLNRTT